MQKGKNTSIYQHKISWFVVPSIKQNILTKPFKIFLEKTEKSPEGRTSKCEQQLTQGGMLTVLLKVVKLGVVELQTLKSFLIFSLYFGILFLSLENNEQPLLVSLKGLSTGL